MAELLFVAALLSFLTAAFTLTEKLATLFTDEEIECWDDMGLTPDEVASFFQR